MNDCNSTQAIIIINQNNMAKEKYNRPDYSVFLVHFTKDGEFCNKEQDKTIIGYKNMTAKERLLSILKDKKISASRMPWTNTQGVCFTECPWSSLIAHAQCYSPYGIGFKKSYIFSQKGAPIFYLRSNLFERMKKEMESKQSATVKEMWTFISPFSPKYGTDYTKQFIKVDGKRMIVDYTHEREWRCPKDFSYQYSDIEFIIVKQFSDIIDIPQEVKKAIKDNIIIMDNYQLIENLWPVHRIKEKK